MTANFRAEASGSDWGANQTAKVFCEQSATTTYANTIKLGNAMASYTIFGEFTVVAGAEVKCGLFGQVAGASVETFYDIFVRAELIKR